MVAPITRPRSLGYPVLVKLPRPPVTVLLILGLGLCLHAAGGRPGGVGSARPATSSAPQAADGSFIDVTVLGERGQPLSNLGPEAFQVSVGGQPRRVLAARFVHRGPGAEVAAASAPADLARPLVESSRLVLFAVDENSLLPKGEKAMVSALWRAHEVLGPADRVAMVTLPLARSVLLSADRQPMRDAASRIVGRGAEPSRFAQMLERARPEGEERPKADEAEPTRPEEAVTPGQPPPIKRQETATAQSGGAQEAAMEGEGTEARPRSTSLQVLTRTVAGLRALPGSKTVVLLWGGAAGADPSDVTRAADLRADMPPLIEEAAAANVTIHVLLVPRTPKTRIRNTDLEALAAATGGLALVMPKEGQGLEQLAGAMAGLYRLEVDARPSDRQLAPQDLKVTVSRGKTTVLARKRWIPADPEGYSEPGAATPEENPTPAPATAAPGRNSRRTRDAKPTDPALVPVVARVSEYVEQYVRDLSSVVAEEEYTQRVVALSDEPSGRINENSGRPGGTGSILARRRLTSDLLLLQTPGPDGWVPFRDVVAVDGKPVPDRVDRLRRLFLEHPDTALAQAGAITKESARYNIGGVRRTVNQPTLVLAFLMPGYVDGFRFERKGDEEVEGVRALRLDYEETATPTLIRQGAKRTDVPASGSVWVDAVSGRVLRTRVRATDGSVEMEATVTFRRNDDLGVWTPAEMTETYKKRSELISGTAVYRRFRRFQVTTEEKIK